MSAKPPRSVLEGKLSWHPAARAWRTFSGDRAAPARIEVLREGGKADTFRMIGLRSGDGPVIAQRSNAEKARLERFVYERILPHLPVTAPRYFGALEESSGFVWLFLEDVGSRRYLESSEAELALAGRWVGLMHTSAATLPAAAELPDGGPHRYLEHLRAARKTIRLHLDNPTFAAEERDALERLTTELDSVEGEWTGIACACTGLPPTLVHGDFRPKNAYLCEVGGGRLELFPIDWEMAGWGVPAVDLTRISLAGYREAILPAWPGTSEEDLGRLDGVGRVFRALAGIRWLAPQLANERPSYLSLPIASLRSLQRSLAAALAALGAAA